MGTLLHWKGVTKSHQFFGVGRFFAGYCSGNQHKTFESLPFWLLPPQERTTDCLTFLQYHVAKSPPPASQSLCNQWHFLQCMAAQIWHNYHKLVCWHLCWSFIKSSTGILNRHLIKNHNTKYNWIWRKQFVPCGKHTQEKGQNSTNITWIHTRNAFVQLWGYRTGLKSKDLRIWHELAWKFYESLNCPGVSLLLHISYTLHVLVSQSNTTGKRKANSRH